MTDFIIQLKENFSSRLNDFSIPKDIIEFVRDPFSIETKCNFSYNAKKVPPSIDEAALQLELKDLQASAVLRAELKKTDIETFWTTYIGQESYANLSRLSMLVLSMFGSTNTCE